MRLLGNKVESRVKMADAGVPLIPGMRSSSHDVAVFERPHKRPDIGDYQGRCRCGGKGMRIVNGPDDLKAAVEAAQREAKNAFGDDTVYLEKYISNPRHVSSRC